LMDLPPLTFNAWLRHDVIWEMLREMGGVERVLEVGAGEGGMAPRLSSRFTYVGVELDERSSSRARDRLAKAGRGTVLHGDLSVLDPSAIFDVVCAFEVLEHIEDDRAALTEWRERLRPGGWLLLSVPARPRSFGPSDVLAGHYRRYEPAGLADLLREVGFTDVRVRMYGFPLGYVLEWGRNWIAKRRGTEGSIAERTSSSGRHLQPSDGMGWVTWSVTAPFRLLQRPWLGSSLGTGLVARARRSG
jgi:SAM-dependent methyltransferase